LEFVNEGCKVVVADINFDGVLETVGKIESAGGSAHGVQTDVTNPSSVQALVADSLTKFSRVDVLVNNAAIMINKTLEDTTVEEWNRQVSVNLGGIFLCSKFFLPHLKRTKGNIVNMASVNGFFVEPLCAVYCATKGAIIALTKGMAIDYGKDGVRVNCLCPGYIDSGLAHSYFEAQRDPAAARAAAGKLHSLGRIGQPQEVGKVAVFVASDDASFMTGSAVVVDGGFSSGLPGS
jgi:NAD(P)-dependent dehydrogenase (short-subunit alcohol dehydrogenase family)